MTRHDVAVVGGGPAGLSAALALARAGLQVVLLERSALPVDRACGEGILPQGVAALAQLGVTPPGMPIRGIEYHDPRVGKARASFKGCSGMGVRRTALVHGLLAACDGRVDVRDGCAVGALEGEAGAWRLNTGSGAVEARYLVVADGPRSPLRAQLGLQAPPPLKRRRLGWRQHLKVAVDTDHVEVHWADGCEAYLTPVAPDQLGIALLWSEGTEVPQGKDRLGQWLHRFDGLHERFGEASTASAGRGTGPMAVAARRAAFAGGCLVGDALCFYDGITGEGLSAAFAQALVLAQALPGQLDGRDSQGLNRQLWQTLGGKKRLAQLVLQLHDHPNLRRRVIRLFAKRPSLFEWALMKGVGSTA